MTKKFCDACGHEVYANHGDRVTFVAGAVHADHPHNEAFDLCKSCSLRMRKLVRDIEQETSRPAQETAR